MSRRPRTAPRAAGQVTTTQAAGGLAVVAALAAAVVALCHWLVLPPSIDAPPPGPGEPVSVAAQACPDEDALPAGRLTVTASELVLCPDLFDGRTVTYTGEAVAAVLLRDDHAWVQLNDDPYALVHGPLPAHRAPLGGNTGVAVALPLDVAGAIRHVGDHRTHGDTVEVVGTFLRADPADGGGPTIQAGQAAIVREGRPVAHPVGTRKLVAAGVFALLTLLAAAELYRFRRTR